MASRDGLVMTGLRAARAPGRVVLIGDHTDYTGGLVCAMAIDRWTTVRGRRGGGRFEVTTDHTADTEWVRYVEAVAAQLGVEDGFTGAVSTTIPVGAGLSSSAALEVATALALGFEGSRSELALLCQRAEHPATGLPSGVLDQLTSVSGVADHALLLDCATLDVAPVPVPAEMAVAVVFVAHRRLVGSPYAERVAQCAAAEAVVGPLRAARLADLEAIDDPVVHRRARHVVTENARVRSFASALAAGDVREAGRLLDEGHESLRADYETSTPQMDEAARQVRALRGVSGVRMTGGGFGGCLVALTAPGVDVPGAWTVRAVDGAHVLEVSDGAGPGR